MISTSPVLASFFGVGLFLAHAAHGSASGFVSGLTHPIGGLDHVLAMIAVGLWGAQLGRPAIWVLPVAFPIAMAIGGALGLIGLPLPGVEFGIALSAVVLGLMVLLEAKPPLWVAGFIVAAFAIFHGHAHGTELPHGADGTLYSVGFVISTGLLHSAGIAIGLLHKFDWGRSVVRAGGLVVLLGGVWFLYSSIAA